jgi:hypothetical protein
MFVPRADVHNCMYEQLANGDAGVYVHFSIYHSGKSTSARLIATRILDSGRGVKYLNARTDSLSIDINSAENWFRRAVGFTTEGDDLKTRAQLFEIHSKRRPQHTTIFINEADALMELQGWERFIKCLTHVSVDYQTWNTMLCCSNPMNVDKILDLNGRTKIKMIAKGILFQVQDSVLFAKWTKEEIKTFIVDRYRIRTEETLNRLALLGEKAGSPEIVKSILNPVIWTF